MRTIFALLLLSIQGIAPGVAGTPANKRPYFRQARGKAVKPKQGSGTPVVVNAASYLPGVSPGGLATIFGQDLTNVSGVVVAGTNPLPTELANVSVTVNDIPAPLFGVAYANGEDQISFQCPYETPTGPGAAEIQVFNNGDLVVTLQADSFTEDPGIFMYDGNYAIAEHGDDGSLIGPNNPAQPGEIIILYVTGLGPLTLNLQDGYGAPSNPLAYTEDPFQVDVDNESCKILFSGLGPGFVGLYQINLVLPSDLPSGDLNVQIYSTYSNSGVAVLPVD